MVTHTAAGVQQNKDARNPAMWVEAHFVVMAVHGLIRLADGLRLAPEFEEGSSRRPLIAIPDEKPDTTDLLGEIAKFFEMERAPAVFRALGRRPLYLKMTWRWIRSILEPDLLPREQKTLIALAVSAAAGSDYGTDFFGHEARRLGADEEAIWEVLCVVQRFAGLTKFASGLDLRPDFFPDWGEDGG